MQALGLGLLLQSGQASGNRRGVGCGLWGGGTKVTLIKNKFTPPGPYRPPLIG